MFNSSELFYVIDDFFLKIETIYWPFLKQKRDSLRIRIAQLTISEICFIAIWYKCSHFNNFKAFFAWLKEQNVDLITYHRKTSKQSSLLHLMNNT
jgi:hypothetical protein